MSEKPAAVVTGASRGIGAETAVALAKAGYDVALMARSVGDLETVAGAVRDAGSAALVLPGDLADLDYAEQSIAAAAAQFGHIDLLVNNAAWREVATMRTLTLDSWEKTLRICLTAPAFLARWCATHMEQSGSGVIINISSVQSERVAGICPAYVASKGAMDALTRELSVLYGPRGIRVVALNPGAIDTEMSGDYEADDGANLTDTMREVTNDFIPLRRWGTPEEMAQTIVFLASPGAGYITGTTLFADGGVRSQFSPYSLKRRMFPDEF
jgi:3-oxoacyl-[acyl-carrier protein] reductase